MMMHFPVLTLMVGLLCSVEAVTIFTGAFSLAGCT